MESKFMVIMDKLAKRFRYEVANVDPLHPDIECDTTFLRRYTKAYDYWKIYMMLPKDHVYKTHYLCLLADILAEMGEVI